MDSIWSSSRQVVLTRISRLVSFLYFSAFCCSKLLVNFDAGHLRPVMSSLKCIWGLMSSTESLVSIRRCHLCHSKQPRGLLMSLMEVCVSVNGLIFQLSEAHCVGTAFRAVVGLVEAYLWAKCFARQTYRTASHSKRIEKYEDASHARSNDGPKLLLFTRSRPVYMGKGRCGKGHLDFRLDTDQQYSSLSYITMK